MNKLEEFKEFIKRKPFLKEKVDNKETTWQSLYETYDLFGEEADVFLESKKEEKDSSDTSKETRNSSGGNTSNLLKMLEGVDLDKVSQNLEGMKKILGVLGEFTKKEDPKVSRRTMPKTPRRFDD